ncbi:MAG: PD-(D/E)XK nuclease family protein [Bacilli bacterium]|nr:PD-(D/E)XK nuclease family protein [Bacilli bacterium]
MTEFIKDNSILIIPNNLKLELIRNIRLYNKDLNVKIFSLDEFIKKLTFDYDEKTIYELMKLENVNYNIAKLYLNNIKYVDKYYNIDKLDKLYDIKCKLNDFLIKDNLFYHLIKEKEIIIYGYDYINKYQYKVLNNVNNLKVINKKYNDYNHNVYKFNTLEDEVIFVAEKICELINNNIDINSIFISNLDNNYYNVIDRIFSMYNIPINLNNNNNLYQTNIGKYFINNLNNDIDLLLSTIENKFDMNNINNKNIYNKLIDCLNKFYFTKDYLSIKDNIINVMKNTFINNIKYINAVNEIDIVDNNINDDKYIFLVGFNLNKIPRTYKDEDYINDNIKLDYMEKSYEMNIINKSLYYKIISSIKNLFISFNCKHLNENFYPSILIDEYKMNVIEEKVNVSKYSNKINELLLASSLDNLIKYNTLNNNLNLLFNNYKINYMKYDNRFNGIDKNILYKYLNNTLNISYSSMDNYYHCSFKYYLSNILKLDYFEETIQTYIGNLFHYVLSKAYLDNFDFDECVHYFISNNPYPDSKKSEYFLNKVLDELRFIVKTIEYQNTLMDMDEAFYEKKIIVEKNKVININFKGFIDKLLKKDNSIVIIDYKTYNVDINLNYLPYGLSMQLPVYLYLTKNLNKDYEIIGFYLQQILFNKMSKKENKTLKEQKMDNLKLKGYSIGNEEKLMHFDTSYENSELIHGMKLTSKGFGPYSKVLTNKQIDNIVKFTDERINDCVDGVINGDFIINPKKINGKNIGCEFCKFKDICFMTNKDLKELDDIKDLSFLDE